MPESSRLPRVELGSTGMEISRIGFGAWAIGGSWQIGWGPQNDRDSIAAIQHAVSLGINWIDTAPVYGYGHSESVICQALAGLDEKPLLFSKASLIEGPDGMPVSCLKRDSIRREIEGTLTRLGVDALDLYQVHESLPEADLEEGWATFAELKEEGLVRHIGVSNFNVEQIRRIQTIAPVETIQPPFSLIDREAERELLPFCEAEGIGVIVYSPMGSGMLAGRMSRERIQALPKDDWRLKDAAFNEPMLARNLELADRVKRIGESLGLAAGVIALAWVLRNPAVDGAIVGLRRAEQVDDLIAAAAFELSDDDADALALEGA